MLLGVGRDGGFQRELQAFDYGLEGDGDSAGAAGAAGGRCCLSLLVEVVDLRSECVNVLLVVFNVELPDGLFEVGAEAGELAFVLLRKGGGAELLLLHGHGYDGRARERLGFATFESLFRARALVEGL